MDEWHGDDEHTQGKADEEEDVDLVHHQPRYQQPSGAANTGNNLSDVF